MKIKALKQSILLILSGESLPRVLMSVIRFCSNADDHMLKKLLMLYWEVRQWASGCVRTRRSGKACLFSVAMARTARLDERGL